MRPSKRTAVLVAVPGALLLGAASVAWAQAGTAEGEGEEQSAPSTAEVAVRDLAHTETLSGVITYDELRAIPSGRSGTVTRLPEVGETVASGEELMRIDEEPVVLVDGSVPAWRDLQYGVSDGADVRQLEEALVALGHAEESPTFPDRDWDWATSYALQEFQDETGAPVDGVASLGEIVFADGSVRIAVQEVAVGGQASAGQPVVQVSATDRIVTVELAPLDRDLVSEDMAVEVALPTGERLPGTVTEVGSTLEANAEGEDVYQVTVALEDSGAADDLALAPVSVSAVSTVAEDALTVPVTAVVGVPGGGHAVDLVGADGTTTRVPVELGAWGDGFVQVAGGVSEGDLVEVPE
ncbi:efflux RND transporter periplasmic adaptor subunit [Allonocardiopsis opalescens]|uniref:Multidrug efflux pump subunit AcrA (Membrane-fusion protein) n=1 Tax=Allonocardiopsis opalescens TaxID=1144618 RepID=A0A2T0Q2Q8_9ACTN|nr:HlyD family efflux transporter periplasmic adaptor subunit [Allonocardiopsis opalescens]PRX98087.1 multidrug efflux pump subunit AcrA (membrane-fusion protein) [Allonocardiopsis opalescens]